MNAKAFTVESLSIVMDSVVAAATPEVAVRLKDRNEKGKFNLALVGATDDSFITAALDKEEAKEKLQANTKAAAEARAAKAEATKAIAAEKSFKRNKRRSYRCFRRNRIRKMLRPYS